MQAFTIDAENNITFYASLKQTEGSAEGTETFSSPKELGKLAAHWPGARLVEIWNSLPGVVPVKKFTSRGLAVTRIWKAPAHQAHRWRTQADGGDEEGGCGEEG